MSAAPVQRKSPLLRIAESPVLLRAGVLGGIGAVYLITFALTGPDARAAMRPVNLVLVALGGLFFGMRAGAVIGLVTVSINMVLYSWAGILLSTVGTFSGNLLSIVVGIATGVGVGRLRDLSLELHKQVAMRLDAERRKDELVAHLVHDLKNPLTAISGHAQLMLEAAREGELPEVESAQYIRTSAERMSRMVMNLLDVGRAEEGLLVPRYQPLELSRMLEEVQASVQRQLIEREQQLVVVQKYDDSHVAADPDLLSRIVLNLLENAIKYTPRRHAVRLELNGTESEIELCVMDQGPGIPAGYEERIFEKYARLERDLSTAADASRGLGLHFCKLAITAHGGRIWVEPNVPQGSVFRVRLPRGPTVRA